MKDFYNITVYIWQYCLFEKYTFHIQLAHQVQFWLSSNTPEWLNKAIQF